jgi:serine/threonine protein phosphatase PrpC
VKLAAGSATDQGQSRDNNEDAFLVDDERALFAVADGMGGHRAGEVASRTAIESLRASIASGVPVNEAIARANSAVIDRAEGDGELEGMGTTMTAVVPAGGHQLLVGHVGDSRAYMVHEGNLRRVTEDHSLVEELVREGRLTAEQAESHPQRAIITRALGIDSDVDVDVYTLDVNPGDRLIVCSDGLNTMVRDRDVERIARAESDPQHAAEALVAAANAAGGEDNITVIVIDVLEVDPAAAVDPAALVPSGSEAARPPVEITPPPPAPDVAPRRSRWRTVRGIVLVLVPILLILGIAAGATGWYARGSYYVGTAGDEVVIYKGVPGGVLGWDPTIDERTRIAVADLSAVDRDRVRSNTARGSLGTAQAYVTQLQGSITTTTTTTTTTRPRRRRAPKVTTTTVRR